MRNVRCTRWLVGVTGALALAVAGCGGGDSDGGSAAAKERPKIRVTFFDHAAPMQDHLIATNDRLKAMVPAEMKFSPVQSGPAALAGYKGGSFEFVESVGSPPIAGAIAAGINFHVIWPETQNSAFLVVEPSINTMDDLKGKKLGDLVGSGEDYEFKGFLEKEGLKDSVKLVQVNDQQNLVPAFKSGGIDGAYTDLEYAEQMMKDGAVAFKMADGQRVDAKYICGTLKVCSFNSATVADDFAKEHPEVVQGYVCALYEATKIERGPNAAAAFRASASLTGADPEAAARSGAALPTVDPERIPTFLSPASSEDPEAGTVAKGVTAAAQALEDAGQIHMHLSEEQVQDHMDPQWAQNALDGKCTKG